MPRDIQILGPLEHHPTLEQTQRVSNFLQWSPAKKKPSSVVIVPHTQYESLRHKIRGQDDGYAFTVGDRTYLSDKLFSLNKDDIAKYQKGLRQNPSSGYQELGTQLSPETSVEWTLAHELGHLNDSGSAGAQETHDWKYNNIADQMVADWNSKQGKAYQAEQSRIDNDTNRVLPSPSPISTTLQPPAALSRIKF